MATYGMPMHAPIQGAIPSTILPSSDTAHLRTPLNHKTLLWVGAAAAAAHLLILLPLHMVVQAAAVLLLGGLLPGLLLVEAVTGRTDAPPTLWERALFAVAAGYGVMVIVMLGLSYLPGTLNPWQTLLAFDVVLLLLLAIVWRRTGMPAPGAAHEWAGMNTRWLVAGALVLLILGGTLRFTNLGYTDFQGDEARAALRAAAVIQGYDDVLMLHKKGPTEILLPTAIYSATGVLNEATARLPFTIAGVVALFAVWLLGWRIFSPLAGWLAALFVALDGYFIGFARIVQYQSIVLLMSICALLVIVRLVQKPQALAPWLSMAALFIATGVLSHYEGVLVAIPAAYLLGVLCWRERARGRALLGAVAIAAGVGALLLGVFYIPYVLNPHFGATYTYLTDRRIGNSFPYNNLHDVFIRTTLYSTTYVVLLLIGLTVAGMVGVFMRGWQRALALALSFATVALAAVTLWNPTWATLGAAADGSGGADWVVIPMTIMLGLVILSPRQRAERRAIWLWFGMTMVLAIFLTEKPRTHVYTFFMPWMLLAGDVAASGWQWLHTRISARNTRVWNLIGAGVAGALILFFGFYAFRMFSSRDEVLFNYDTARPAGYWTVYDEPDDKAIFGFPLDNGWKVVGELYRTGQIAGPFDSSEKEAWVPAWYGRGEERCRRDADWYFEIRNLEPWSNRDQREMEGLLAEGFEKWGRVQVGGVDKMIIYQRTGVKSEDPAINPVDTPLQGLPILHLEDFAPAFDAASSPLLPLTYPAVDPKTMTPIGANFDNLITLEGYALEAPTPLRAGDRFRLTLYWRAQQPLEESFKVFNQVYFGDSPMIAQRDGFPVCEDRHTDQWDPGELITDSYMVPVAANAPDGLYPLYTGLYNEATGDRLSVLDGTGAPVDSQVHVTDIRIGDAPESIP